MRRGIGVERAIKVIALFDYASPEKIERAYGIPAAAVAQLREEYIGKRYVLGVELVTIAEWDEDEFGCTKPRQAGELQEYVWEPQPVGLDPLRRPVSPPERARELAGLRDKARERAGSFRIYDDGSVLCLGFDVEHENEDEPNLGIIFHEEKLHETPGAGDQTSLSVPHRRATDRDEDGWSAWDADKWLAAHDGSGAAPTPSQTEREELPRLISVALAEFGLDDRGLRDAFVRGNLSYARRRAREAARVKLKLALWPLWTAYANRAAIAESLGICRDTLYQLMGE
jgi:hypothetical protein